MNKDLAKIRRCLGDIKGRMKELRKSKNPNMSRYEYLKMKANVMLKLREQTKTNLNFEKIGVKR